MQIKLVGMAWLFVTGFTLALAGDDPPKPEPTAAEKLLERPEAFQTLVNPPCSHCVDEAKRRAGELGDDDRVLAWIRGKYDGGGIPYRFFLVPYRVISDTYGVFVYDPDAGFVRGYEPSLDFTFHGWRNGIMVMRHKDGTLYSALSGRAFAGPRKGDELKAIPTLETTWGYWSAAYPGTVAYHMYEKYQPIELPESDHADSVGTRLEYGPSAIPPMTEVLGVALGDRAKAYRITSLEKAGGLLTDRVGDQRVVVLWYAPTRTAAIYAPEVDQAEPPQAVTLAAESNEARGAFRDRETGSLWSIEGRAVEGPLAGKTLRWLPGVQCRWFAWRAEYPASALVGEPKSPKRASKKRSPKPDSPDRRAAKRPARPPLEAVLVDPGAVTAESVAAWRREGFRAAALVLDEQYLPSQYQAAAEAVREGPLDLYYWIEVARNPRMAAEHPEWMASLGLHQDWQERFPQVALPKKGEVAKAYPWVPIGYRESFDAHLARVAGLLEKAAGPYRGLLVNDLQGGPASCGCGNLQCRWAIDYGVPATATRLAGDDLAARFVAEVRKLAGAIEVIPVWMTECEDQDLPASLSPNGKTTGYCGSVPCSRGTCPQAFTAQWSALVAGQDGPIGILAAHKELDRLGGDQGQSAAWIQAAVDYLDTVPPEHFGEAVAHKRLWLVVQGYDLAPGEQADVRRAARETGAGAVIVALARLDQSYEPRIIRAARPAP